jgi:hypothetical protein
MPLFQKPGFTMPDLVTAIVEPERGGTWKLTFVGIGSLPADSKGHADMDALVAGVDREIAFMYQPRVGSEGLGVQYAWYPWGTPKPAKKGTPDVPTSLLIFDIETGLGYRASLDGDRGVQGVASRLALLPDVIAAAVRARWPGLGDRPPPAMFTWNRVLTYARFEPYRRS